MPLHDERAYFVRDAGAGEADHEELADLLVEREVEVLVGHVALLLSVAVAGQRLAPSDALASVCARRGDGACGRQGGIFDT